MFFTNHYCEFTYQIKAILCIAGTYERKYVTINLINIAKIIMIGSVCWVHCIGTYFFKNFIWTYL